VKPITEYAKSAVYLARFHLERGGGDLVLALQLMEKVAASNSEEVETATSLVKRITAEIDAQRGGVGAGVRGPEKMDTKDAERLNFVQ